MADFDAATRPEGSDGRYQVQLSRDWEVWGPVGGYVAAIALRAMGAASALDRPASFACQFLSVARFEPVQIEVSVLRRGRRSEALRADLMQGERLVLAASAWTVASEMTGLEHEDGAMPAVPAAEALKGYQDLADNYAEWYPFWRSVEGRPARWTMEPGPPVWHTWLRLSDTASFDDPFLEAARALLWLDIMMWNAAIGPHGMPPRYIAPNLDLAAQFHAGAPECEWLLADAHCPAAREGLMGCSGRVWAPDGRLLASGVAQLFCRPNPEAGTLV